jgi:hypothetical protein
MDDRLGKGHVHRIRVLLKNASGEIVMLVAVVASFCRSCRFLIQVELSPHLLPAIRRGRQDLLLEDS